MFAISVQDVKGETELCHLTIVPVYPDKVSKLLVFPEQMVDPPETDPPIETGKTVTTATFDKTVATYGLGLTLFVLERDAFLRM